MRVEIFLPSFASAGLNFQCLTAATASLAKPFPGSDKTSMSPGRPFSETVISRSTLPSNIFALRASGGSELGDNRRKQAGWRLWAKQRVSLFLSLEPQLAAAERQLRRTRTLLRIRICS